MRITAIKLTVLEATGPVSIPVIKPVPDSPRPRYWRAGRVAGQTPHHERLLRVVTDEGLEGLCTASTPEITPHLLEVLRTQVLGADPLCREELYQRLHHGTRLLHVPVGWFGPFDNCL